MAASIARGLSEAGWAVVSGLARGIDGAAHRAALEGSGGTVAVLGHGLLHEYPAENRPLFKAIRSRGLLVSEFAPRTTPEPGMFPRRNRIIAGLASLVVVVQAGRKSGALITANLGLELHGQVLVVPGTVGPAINEGLHDLLRDGAGIATSAEDVLFCVGETWRGLPSRPDPVAGRSPDEHVILRTLTDGPLHPDDVAARSGLDVGVALTRLCQLELDGSVAALAGGRYEAT